MCSIAPKESSRVASTCWIESRPTGTELNPFSLLLSEMDRVSTHGCRLNEIGGYKQPAGTFRRMHSSRGLIHADTVTLLNHSSGQFSANIYVQAPAGSGALSVYPAQQVGRLAHLHYTRLRRAAPLRSLPLASLLQLTLTSASRSFRIYVLHSPSTPMPMERLPTSSWRTCKALVSSKPRAST